jgi:uncharacterized protein (DUF885 family)
MTGASVLTSQAGDELEALIQDRFDRYVSTWPSRGTSLGVHEHDGRLADLSRTARLADLAAERAYVGQLEAIGPAALSEEQRFERDLALHSARLRLFEGEVVRTWERRTLASDEIGDALFLLMARDFAPLQVRLESLTQRIEGIPSALQQVRDNLGPEPVTLWLELEEAAAAELPLMINDVVSTAQEAGTGRAELKRLMAAARATHSALTDYATWTRTQLGRAGDRIALGRTELDELVSLRAFDGLDTDDILAIGEAQLAAMHEVRQAAGRSIDPDLSEAAVVARVKADGPVDFDAALAGYRDAMLRARAFVEERGLATLPVGDVLDVIPTPKHMRSTMPLAAYFEPAAFDRPIRGVYVVTPSVDGDPGAMNEHNWSSIVNTSVHEAYPGHHLQLSAALSAATPARLLVEAPEFVEGWGMYCEQMMLNEGFEDSPARRVIVATDAIWRAARIILDIRLHRGEIGVPEAIDFLVEHTGFERPVARAEVYRYTQTPGYNLSYLLGKVLLLRLRADEQWRLGDAFTLRGFHDALLYSGSLPISFHRRLLAGQGGGPTAPTATGVA